MRLRVVDKFEAYFQGVNEPKDNKTSSDETAQIRPNGKLTFFKKLSLSRDQMIILIIMAKTLKIQSQNMKIT